MHEMQSISFEFIRDESMYVGVGSVGEYDVSTTEVQHARAVEENVGNDDRVLARGKQRVNCK